MQRDLNNLDEQLEQLPHQAPEADPKAPNLPNTCMSFRHRSTMSTPTALDVESLLDDPFDTSFDQEMHSDNIKALFQASIKYLEQGLTESFDKDLGFKDKNLFSEPPFEEVASNEYETLVNMNELFNPFERTAFKGHLQEEGALIGFIKQLIPVFGITVSQELTYIFSQVLQYKLGAFRKWRQSQESLLPKLGCFYGYEEDERPLEVNCGVYEDLSIEELNTFSTQDVEEIAKKVTFSRQINLINFRKVKLETSSKFSGKLVEFVRTISRLVFYTVAGVTDPDVRALPSELSREVSFAEMPEGLVRAPSRPFVPCEDQPGDFLSKKRKFQ